MLPRAKALFIPRCAVHQFDDTGDIDARALAIVTPASSARLLPRGRATLDAAGPPDHAAIAAVMRRHGLTHAPWELRSRPANRTAGHCEYAETNRLMED
jgi:hypothetical protein